MSKIGGDIEQLGQLKATFDRQGQNVQELIRSISGAVNNTWWIGPHAEKFRSDWSGTYQPQLSRLQEQLTQLGMDVEQKRQQLQQAGS